MIRTFLVRLFTGVAILAAIAGFVNPYQVATCLLCLFISLLIKFLF